MWCGYKSVTLLQELRSGLENQSWLWLPGLSSFTYYVPRLSTEHLEKILSSRKELPSEEVPNIVVPFHVKHVHVRDIEDGSHRLGCTILSTLPGVTVSALWMVHARVRHVLNSSESSLEEVVKDLMENAPYKTELSLRNSAAAGSELVGDDTSSPLLPVSGQLDRSSETESVVAASEYLLDGLVPPEIARTTATLRSLLSSNMPTVEPLVLVLRPALACEDLSAPQVMVFVVHFSGSLQVMFCPCFPSMLPRSNRNYREESYDNFTFSRTNLRSRCWRFLATRTTRIASSVSQRKPRSSFCLAAMCVFVRLVSRRLTSALFVELNSKHL